MDDLKPGVTTLLPIHDNHDSDNDNTHNIYTSAVIAMIIMMIIVSSSTIVISSLVSS